jgi:hypothetical protein
MWNTKCCVIPEIIEVTATVSKRLKVHEKNIRKVFNNFPAKIICTGNITHKKVSATN